MAGSKRSTGETDEDRFGRIVGGSEVERHDFPWMVAMLNYGRQICGGTLISNQWVLTAAHCFSSSEPSPWGMKLGEHHLNENSVFEMTVNVEKILIHEKYSQYAHSYDIALVKLAQPVPAFDNYINPTCLQPANDASFPFGTTCTVTGWGTTSFQGSSPDVLHGVDVKLLEDSKCAGVIEDPASMICAGVLAGGKDSCQGDSGGPLVCKKDNRYYIVGVVSYGEGCAAVNKPGIYTDVNHYLPWIQKTVSGN